MIKSILLTLIFSLILITSTFSQELPTNNQKTRFLEGIVLISASVGTFVIIETFIPNINGIFILYSIASIIGTVGLYLIIKSIDYLLAPKIARRL